MIINKCIIKLLFSACLFVVALPASAGTQTNKQFVQIYKSAISHFKAGNYIEAESLFSQTIGYKARMAQAVSAFRLKQTKRAMSLFMQSVLLADTDSQRFSALYNAATCRFIKGNFAASNRLFTDALKYKASDQATAQFIELTAYLDRLVLADIARQNARSNKKKSSEGKKTISAIDFEFDDDINLRLEDNESSDTDNKNARQPMISDRELLKRLIKLGIEAVDLNASSDDSFTYIDINIADEFSSLESLSYTSPAAVSDLWKRIFELEQGYPASLEFPETLPGVRPW